MKTLTIATRKSPLALWQAEFVKAELERCHADLRCELLPLSTRGDKILDTPLAKIGGKGLFLKELEHALLNGEADLAVHSMKDVPVDMPEGLNLALMLARETPWDAFVSNQYKSLDALPAGAVVGSSSLRRQAQLRAIRPDLQIRDLRGNVNTRLRKLDEGEYDAILLAVAGLKRLGMDERIRETLQPPRWLPAAAQGALGIEIRSDDTETLQRLEVLSDPETWACVSMERAFNRRLGGSCQVPIAAYAERKGLQWHLQGLVAAPDGSQVIRGECTAGDGEQEQAGEQLAEQLLSQGADAILAALDMTPAK